MVVMDVLPVLDHGNVEFVCSTIITMEVRAINVSLQTASAARLIVPFVMVANLALV